VARAPEIRFYARAFEQEENLQQSLLQLAYRYSAFIENTGPGICTLDLKAKRTRHHEPWVRELLSDLRSLGIRAQAGIGPNPEIALQAAKLADPILEIGQDSKLLQALGIDSLQPSSYLLEILKSWGIRTLGALSRLPREEIGQRLGLEGLALWDRAAGRSSGALHYVHPPQTFLETADFEQPLEVLEPLLFIVRRFLERLALRIEAVYQLVAEIRLALILEDGNQVVRTLQIPAPTREVETLFRIASQYLETVQTAAPVVGLRVEAIPSKPIGHQFDLFQDRLKDPNGFFHTLARLAALVGNDRVGIPRRENSHKPDDVRLEFPRLNWSRKTDLRSAPKIGPALRRYRPAISAVVEVQNDRPIALRSERVSGKILEARGPWKLSGNWWDHRRWQTEEWDVELADGGVYRLSQSAGQWGLEGVYD
jgi:protein ImuB